MMLYECIIVWYFPLLRNRMKYWLIGLCNVEVERPVGGKQNIASIFINLVAQKPSMAYVSSHQSIVSLKARLAHENTINAGENRFLGEVVEYHQLTMQDVVYLDDRTEEVTEVYTIKRVAKVLPDQALGSIIDGRTEMSAVASDLPFFQLN
ncbi:hypothetical protein V6N13_139239 [Hibiscus sabdariffa]